MHLQIHQITSYKKCTVLHQIFVVQYFHNFRNNQTIMKLFTTNIYDSCGVLLCVEAMNQLNLFKYFKASLPSQQVDFAMP